MPLIDFWLLTPGNHHSIGEKSLDWSPRAGEVVTFEGISRTVHSIASNADLNTTLVFLRDHYAELRNQG